MISQDYIKTLFNYADGKLISRLNRGKLKKGQVVGNIDSKGYLRTKVDYKAYRVHRLIFLYVNGWLPEFIDHKDTDKLNNNIDNLRPCTSHQNAQNVSVKSTNTSGVKCVDWVKRDKVWRVRLRINGIRKVFGYFKDLELAELVASEARALYHGKFARSC